MGLATILLEKDMVYWLDISDLINFAKIEAKKVHWMKKNNPKYTEGQREKFKNGIKYHKQNYLMFDVFHYLMLNVEYMLFYM